MDAIESLCYGAVALLIVLMCWVGYEQSQYKNELNQLKVECQKYEKTSDYIACIKPINAKIKQMDDDADDAAVISTSIMLATQPATY